MICFLNDEQIQGDVIIDGKRGQGCRDVQITCAYVLYHVITAIIRWVIEGFPVQSQIKFEGLDVAG